MVKFTYANDQNALPMIKKLLLTVLTLSMLVTAGQAQDRQVSGKVTSMEDGSGIPGVNIVVQGTSKGTTTDVDGNYTLALAPSENTLVFSFVGYKTFTASVDGRTTLDVVLELEVSSLEEVVVVGYGTQRKRDVTGTIASVKAEDLETQPNSNPVSSIQGRVAGVTIVNSGVAGASPTIRIRGVGTTTNSNAAASPLYVVDGIFTNNIDFVNPNDITSMEILKDPSSLAMFGVQGANGVIIVTTKRAKAGQTNIDFSSYVGLQKVTNKIDVTNAEQFKMLYNEQQANLGAAPYDFSPYTANTNWQDLIFRDAIITNTTLSINSGTEKNSATFSLNYFKQDGVVKYDAYRRVTAHFRDEYTVNKHLKVGVDMNVFRFDRDPFDGGATNSALWAAPVYAPQDDAGNWNAAPSFQRAQVGNPYAFIEIYKDKTISHGYRFVGSAFAQVNFLKNFTWKSVFYTDLGFNSTRSYNPLFNIQGAQFNNVTSVSQEKANFTTWQMDHTLTYATTLNDDHDITVLAGITQQYKGSDYLTASRQGKSPLNIPDDADFWYVGIGDNDETRQNGGGAGEEVFLSYLFRVNYSFRDKYLLNASFRRDGTSKFSPTHAWGNFASVGAGWVVTEEPFFKDVTPLEFLKLKASWGQLGNDKVGNYLYYPLLNTSGSAVFGENVYPAAVPAYIPDHNLHWEIVTGTDVGFEAAALNSRLSVEFVYYNRETTDILTSISIPGASGQTKFLTNAGSIVNNGIELTLAWEDNLTDDVKYTLGANFTTVHNEVTALGNNESPLFEGPARTAVGGPIGAFYGYVQEGIFQTAEEVAASPQAGKARPGDIRFKDVNNDGIFDDNDRTVIGSPTPDFIFGANLGVTYKNLSLSVDVQGVAGNEIYKQRQTVTFADVNYETNRLGRWTGPGTSNKEPIMDNTRTNNYLVSSYFLDPGDYFRIRNVTLSYNIATEWLERVKMKNAKIYVSAQNLYTFTKATGFTPEIGGTPIAFGIDVGTYPLPATYTIGVNLNF
jgi:TonB-linked SusC/RagA family outer membrane protein